MESIPSWDRQRGRVLALDVGQRRIGLAVSDGLGITAQGLPTLERRGLGQDLDALARLASEQGAALVLIGLPRHLSGTEGRQAEAVRRFGERLGRHTRLPVAYWDERLTTVEAARVLEAAESSLRASRRAIDRLSAVILLQSFLDAHAAARQRAGGQSPLA